MKARTGRGQAEAQAMDKVHSNSVTDLPPSMSYCSGPKTIPENENRNPFLHGVYSPVGERLAIRKQKMLWRK